ncbi:TRAFs-binding domain-containing protein [Accumulibacter sp.]|uniref:TRAFs-binding domain-containing protein n=1 Tax=Accumulibacter sp. TaxID=2053492 RepID=UPI0028C3E6FF|nr:TRAFs-binding domain-containing protein [Accumulibacter sp.]
MSEASEKLCFVVQGFGKKTDYTDGRVLDLDASYAIIKEAVEAAGLKCIRADEIPHTGTIDLPMYEMLLQADLVIADLSTYNVNAAFELGVRYGLRPGTTIIVAESQFKYPFDVGHIVIQTYKHLGEDVGAQEARRFRDALAEAIRNAMSKPATDSPVYTFLQDLQPPQRGMTRVAPSAVGARTSAPRAAPPVRATRNSGLAGSPSDAAARGFSPALSGTATGGAVPFATPSGRRGTSSSSTPASDFAGSGAEIPDAETGSGTGDSNAPQPPTSKALLDQALSAINPRDGRPSNFPRAMALLREVRKQRPNDPFVVQQLALATYKSKLPTAEAALLEACGILEVLGPATTNDPETLGLWGAIHKRLWEQRSHLEDLEETIASYRRGFHLKQDWYNGINLAFLLDLRAGESLRAGELDEAIADSVQAKRIRREVVRLATPVAESESDDPQKHFWVVATLWEAALGLGDAAAMTHWEAAANALSVPQWMQDTRQEQGRKLHDLLASNAALRSG